jgi:hypothetical protein
MLARILRILIGFSLACVAAAVTLVLFVYAPADLANLRDELNGDRLSEAGFFALLITPHVLISAAFPALLAAVYAEQRKLASWPFYALAGLATAAAGFLVQYLTEPTTRAISIFQTYALIAFLTAGLIGGTVYWAFAGRFVATKPP